MSKIKEPNSAVRAVSEVPAIRGRFAVLKMLCWSQIITIVGKDDNGYTDYAQKKAEKATHSLANHTRKYYDQDYYV